MLLLEVAVFFEGEGKGFKTSSTMLLRLHAAIGVCGMFRTPYLTSRFKGMD